MSDRCEPPEKMRGEDGQYAARKGAYLAAVDAIENNKTCDPLDAALSAYEATMAAAGWRYLAAVAPLIRRAALEEAAGVLNEAASRIRGGKKRVNMVDEHTAFVLDDKAAAIRALDT
jgi:hypothetical protein